jgi:hypothetical protein
MEEARDPSQQVPTLFPCEGIAQGLPRGQRRALGLSSLQTVENKFLFFINYPGYDLLLYRCKTKEVTF